MQCAVVRHNCHVQCASRSMNSVCLPSGYVWAPEQCKYVKNGPQRLIVVRTMHLWLVVCEMKSNLKCAKIKTEDVAETGQMKSRYFLVSSAAINYKTKNNEFYMILICCDKVIFIIVRFMQIYGTDKMTWTCQFSGSTNDYRGDMLTKWFLRLRPNKRKKAVLCWPRAHLHIWTVQPWWQSRNKHNAIR